ncbi:tRNA 5-hydroxyuridine modification protein YegQ [Ignatzschineria rhizosphaerae]|uniref:tRNA 5-hydroxyuridine modification protein YegQ n=1 Tax=Ignatzschineria rhizosphaerae TaxID=2923279 RepID=A0ABY3WXL9_9GAMM|nr:tRNA 5-hydroxyuridine modification protein YegQ [Ignatzschineria rhizosphaerae]UNM95354.1 tRNA 5-hydroxyuridine modification protein YegQ [Ignatzschineria rhizosphaerae]
MSKKRSVELLAPAGTFKNLQYAYAYGADAVYAGLPRYSLRVRNNDFRNTERVKMGIDYAHEHGKQFFLAVNTMPHGGKLKTFVDDMSPVLELKPDALIMSDPGLIMMVRERFPDQDIHLSVQSNAVNSATVKFWQKQGLTRVILSRELSLNEIEEIRNECPDMELEVFVHGALCIAYSGRCLLSGYFNHRDANQGTCTNACRWNYGLTDSTETPEGELVPVGTDMQRIYREESQHPNIGVNPVTFIQDAMNEVAYTDLSTGKAYTPHPEAMKPYLIQENGQRKGDWMEISEDEHGTYIMNSKDLRAIQHVQRLIEIGVDSLKIEGRTKSPYYVARTTQLYRQAIDDALAGREFNPELYGKLDGLANRGYTEGFLQRHAPHAYQNYLTGNSIHSRQQYVAEVLEYDAETGLSKLQAKNRFSTGDRLEVIHQHGNRDIVMGEMKTEKGEVIDSAKGSAYVVWADIGQADEMTMLARYLDNDENVD